MRLILASTLLAAGAAIATLAATLPANAETKTYNLSGFTKIEAEAGFTIEFTQSSSWSVVVDSRGNNLDAITIEQVGDTLRIKRPGNHRNLQDVNDIVRVSAPDLEALDLETAITFTAQKLQLDKLSINAQAAIDINIADLRVDTLNVNLEAASEMAASGVCSRLNIEIGAAGSADLQGLQCREANIDVGVASSAHVYASERAVAVAGISSSVLVSGNPKDFRKTTDRLGSTVALAN